VDIIVKKIRQQKIGVHNLFSFQFCEVGGLLIIHKRTSPNLATGQRGKYKNLGELGILWWHAETYYLNLAISDFVSSRSGKFGPFIPKKSFEEVTLAFHFFGCQVEHIC
jgi:hypothetical protein